MRPLDRTGALVRSAEAPPLGKSVLEFVRRAANCREPVLLLGETGTGKSSIARQIHNAGPTSTGPFIVLNCPGTPESLLERELYGNIAGAFTDARSSLPGLLEAADGGTLFLDEVAELSLSSQAKILANLESGSVRRLGSTQERAVSFRLIAATNADLCSRRAHRTFRLDLFHRLSVLQLSLPALRDQKAAIPSIARWLMMRSAPESTQNLSEDTIVCLKHYSWPGNIRELDHAIRRAMIFCDGPTILPAHLPREVVEGSARPQGRLPNATVVGPAEIAEALSDAGGNRTRAARRLGISRTTLWTKIRLFGLEGRGGTQ